MNDNKIYWLHDESESVGFCATEDELHEMIEGEPLLIEISKAQYLAFLSAGYDS